MALSSLSEPVTRQERDDTVLRKAPVGRVVIAGGGAASEGDALASGRHE